MGIFKRKKQEPVEPSAEELLFQEELSKPVCQRKGGKHMWRDFPPYITYSFKNGGSSMIKILEPYVCTFCNEVRKEILENWSFEGYEKKEFFEEYHRLQRKYKDILQPEIVVMDMVHDAILVDRQKLMFWDQLHAPTPPKKEPFELTLGTSYKVNKEKV